MSLRFRKGIGFRAAGRGLLIKQPSADVAGSRQQEPRQHEQVGRRFPGLPGAGRWPRACCVTVPPPGGPRNPGQPPGAPSAGGKHSRNPAPGPRLRHVCPGYGRPWAAKPLRTGRNGAHWAPTVRGLRGRGPEPGDVGAEERPRIRLPRNRPRAGGAKAAADTHCTFISQEVHELLSCAFLFQGPHLINVVDSFTLNSDDGTITHACTELL